MRWCSETKKLAMYMQFTCKNNVNSVIVVFTGIGSKSLTSYIHVMNLIKEKYLGSIVLLYVCDS